MKEFISKWNFRCGKDELECTLLFGNYFNWSCVQSNKTYQYLKCCFQSWHLWWRDSRKMDKDGHSTFPVDTPDSLQDMCIMYCVNNLPVLVSSMKILRSVEDAVSMSQMLGNHLLQYYTKFGINSSENQEFVNQLLQNEQLCNEVVIRRDGVLTADNIIDLSNNRIKSVEMTFFDSDICDGLLHAKRQLLVNNAKHITKICLYQRSISYLQYICGLTEDEDSEGSKLVEGVQHSVPNNAFLKSAMTSTIKQQFTNLKSFSYYNLRTPGNNPASHETHSLEPFLKNTGLQSISLLVEAPHPTKWFFNQPERFLWPNLQSLTLTCYSPIDGYLAAEQSVGGDFFKNLPTLKQLR